MKKSAYCNVDFVSMDVSRLTIRLWVKGNKYSFEDILRNVDLHGARTSRTLGQRYATTFGHVTLDFIPGEDVHELAEDIAHQLEELGLPVKRLYKSKQVLGPSWKPNANAKYVPHVDAKSSTGVTTLDRILDFFR